jgi:hypothetical protein
MSYLPGGTTPSMNRVGVSCTWPEATPLWTSRRIRSKTLLDALDLSIRLARKRDRIRAVRPDAVAATNPGCLLQIGGWLARGGVQLPTFHPVELVDASLRAHPSNHLVDNHRRLAASAGP